MQKKTEEDNFRNSMDLKDENGNVWGGCFCIHFQRIWKRDIILMDERTGTHSARSITELINMLSKKNVSFTDKKEF